MNFKATMLGWLHSDSQIAIANCGAHKEITLVFVTSASQERIAKA